MKSSQLIIVALMLMTACNSYNHEAYISQFKDNVDAEISNYTFGENDSLRLANSKKVNLESLRMEKIANDRFYADNYSWYQLGKNLVLSPDEAKLEANKYGFERPYYFLEYLKCDSVQNPVKNKVVKAVKKRLYAKHSEDSVMISGSSAKHLFAAVHKYERSKYFFFINVDFEKVKSSTDRQKKTAAQMMNTALNRLKEKVEVKDKRYYLTISRGEEIGISESLFLVGKNIYLKMNEDLNKLEKTDPEFVENVQLGTKNARFEIHSWENAWKMYEFYGK
ncbi:hypothetical protein [Ancylomarina sp.]|uniref:hypothetical protein n=1 Tax=Ancylomarina sp. TaxID=1970196 RepID=UPI003569FA80